MTSEAAPFGVLLTNLGTPDAPTPAALRKYLREFLWDRRVVNVPRVIWWLILNFWILRVRPAKSAALYRKVWTPQGSPLLVLTQQLAFKVRSELSRRSGATVPVAVGMRYGMPAIAEAIETLQKKGCRRILVLPLYPQYAAATTASTFDAVSAALKSCVTLPDIRFILSYHDQPEYVAAVAQNIRDAQSQGGAAAKILFSFHGLPRTSVTSGDPYFFECHATARLVAENLGLADEAWQVAFQSRFGEEEWLKPYAAETLRELAKKNDRAVDVVCPGFAVDCLETLEEMAKENRAVFMGAGGKSYRYIPALNDSDAHAGALAAIALRRATGWL